MKIYWAFLKAHLCRIARMLWARNLVAMTFIIIILMNENDCEGCIHDVLEQKKGIDVSPQKYKLDFRAAFGSERDKIIPKVPTHLPESALDKSFKNLYYSYNHPSKGSGYESRPKRYVAHKEHYVKSQDENLGNISAETPSKRSRYKRSLSYSASPSGLRDLTSPTLLNFPQHNMLDYKKLFKPIRIRLFFDDSNIEYTRTSVEYKRLKGNLLKAVKKMSKILSVIPVDGPLLFSRTPSLICGNYWSDQSSSSMTRQRCAIARQSYKGEKCLDEFRIPEDHLLGYPIYKNNTNTPTHVLYGDGRGIRDTDTVIYVQAKKTKLCQAKDVIAYATFCRLDQHNRPVAGFANFCPDYLVDALYDADVLYLTSLHEFFHALGFSKDLFDKFQECHPEMQVDKKGGKKTLQWVCEDRRKIVSFVENQKHIITPAVRNQTQKHLNCSSKPGCPLENLVVPPLQTSSHWEAQFMQGSLMAPTIGLPHLTVLDRITLGVFEDTGWYQVNYDEAEDLVWGKNAGCDFATGSTCFGPSSHYFCQRGPGRIPYACHYRHLDKGRCESDKYLEDCKIYKAHTGMQCTIDKNETKLTEWKGEIYSKQSRCFVANLTLQSTKYRTMESSKSIEGRCYLHRCNGSEILEVKVRDSEWKLCPQGSYIQFEGYDGTLECPSVADLCAYTLRVTLDLENEPNNATLANLYCAKITITFPKLAELRYKIERRDTRPEVAKTARRNLDLFLSQFIKEIVQVSEVDETRILDARFVGNTALQFILLKGVDWATLAPEDPLSSLDPGGYDRKLGDGRDVPRMLGYNYLEVPCVEVVKKLLVTVTEGEFQVPVEGDMYSADKMNFTGMEEETNKLCDRLQSPREKPSQTGKVAAIAVGSVGGAVLVAVGVVIYWKGQIATAVSPAPFSPTTDVRYQPNNGSTIIPPSESGSLGQPTFVT